MDLKRFPPPDAAGARKKPRHSSHLKRVAEIVLALSALSKIRGGRNPTDAEINLIHEARASLTKLCQDLPPNEIVSNEAVAAVIENLGLKEPGLGFRGPQLTVAEKFALTKRKMEESKKYGVQTATYPAQQLKPSFGAADNLNNAAVSSGGYAAAGSPDVHVSAVTPNVVRGERVQIGSNGSSYSYQNQAVNSPANHPPVNAPNWSAQGQVGQDTKVLNQTPVKVEGAGGGMMKSPMTPPPAVHDQNSRSFASPAVSGGQQQSSSKIRFVQTPTVSNNHNEIARIIQKLLQPQLPDQPTWIPPSRDYMSKALTCQTCQLSINEVDNVLICDACEKGYHITCALAPNQRGIPRGEWHCARCLSLSNGKPLPPKYGRVMRSNIQLKAPTNMVPSSTVASSTVSPGVGVVQMSPGNKAGAVNQKALEQKINANVNAGPENPAGLPNCGEDSSFSIRDDHDIAKENTCEDLVVSSDSPGYTEFNYDGVRPVEWIGDPIQVVNEKRYYSSCFVDGITYELQKHALLQSSDGKLVPSKLQSMWEETKTGSKWVVVNNCYFPSDLPEKVDRPSTPESTEVYGSNHESTMMAGLIQGPCDVLPLDTFNEEIERRSQLGADTNNELPPVFMCNWIYDDSKGLLQPVSQ